MVLGKEGYHNLLWRETSALRKLHVSSSLLFYTLFGRLAGWQGHGGLRGLHTTTKASTLPPYQCHGGCCCPHTLLEAGEGLH